MRRKTSDSQKIPSAVQKKERKIISDAISIDKKNFEDILKATKKAKIDLQQSQKDLESKKKEVEKVENILKQKNEIGITLDAKITDKNQKFLLLDKDYEQKESELKDRMSLLEKELDEKLSLKKNEFEVIKSHIANFNKVISGLAIEIENKKLKSNEVDAEIKSKEQTLVKIGLDIDEKEKTKTSLSKEIERLEILVQNVRNLQEEIKNLAPQEIELLKKVGDTKKELENLDKIKSLKMEDLNKKERELNSREAGLIARENQSKEEEKRIRTLGNTLQRHLDKQQIPIKVF